MEYYKEFLTRKMLFYRARRLIWREFIFRYRWFKIIYNTDRIVPREKSIFVDISNVVPNRYLYSFLKFFEMSGYTVFLPRKTDVLRALLSKRAKFTFIPQLMKEGFVKFGKRENHDIVITEEELSNDYFSSLFDHSHQEDIYHIPMCEFPLFYNKYCTNSNFHSVKERKNSVFMAGNINQKYYNNIGKKGYFDIPSRWEVAQFIYTIDEFHKISSLSELLKFLKSGTDQRMILIDTNKDFWIPTESLKTIYNQFDFYLSLPGIEIPQSHNLIEAISEGCIPILHRTYANMFRPLLRDKVNAMIYETLDELKFTLKYCLSISKDEKRVMRNNLKKYYFDHLVPNAIVKKIEKNSFKRIFLQAEVESLSYIRAVSKFEK